MENKRPNVFPTAEERAAAAAQMDKDKLAAFEAEKAKETSLIYNQSKQIPNTSNDIPNNYSVNGHSDAVEQMRLRTEYQLKIKNEHGELRYPDLAETPERLSSITYEETQMRQRTEDQMRLRDEALAKNNSLIQNYQKTTQEATDRRRENVNMPSNNNYQPPIPPSKPPVIYGDSYGKNSSNINPYYHELSQPNYNSPFDVIPLPSEGKTYRNKKKNIRLSYLTTADESILTSPNLLQSGEFLEILINRKILEPDLRYKDLLIGDRNAIMIWLRATGYGEMYPVTLFDEKDVPFDTDINLNDLKTKNLSVEPDAEGLFDYRFTLSGAQIKFKLLTCGDTDEIEKLVEEDKDNNVPVNNTNMYTMERMIIEVNGSRDKNVVKEFSNSMRIRDARAFEEYVDKIGCGIDLNITVKTPGGGSVSTFLPLNLKFFWPNF